MTAAEVAAEADIDDSIKRKRIRVPLNGLHDIGELVGTVAGYRTDRL